MNLSENQQNVLSASGHLLVTGGPGSGKTTVSILKAALISNQNLRRGQKVLFLSFARATISRVIEAIEQEKSISMDDKKRIEVDTYHSFFWRILKSHGYLVGFPRKLSILTPQGEAISLSGIRSEYSSQSRRDINVKNEIESRSREELSRLSLQDGMICFDLFATNVANIISRSSRIRKLISTKYPFIILDEFQDTNAAQWDVVQPLGEFSTLIALADPEQRIFDFIGADPERLDHFRSKFQPTEIDLSDSNYRSPGTDMAKFANDVLSGQFRQVDYVGIEIIKYRANENQAITNLITATYAARTRLVQSSGNKWTLAILVPTKRMTRFVSEKFNSPPAGLTAVHHAASVDMDAAILAAEVISSLLQIGTHQDHFNQFIKVLIGYYHGKGGDSPTQKDLGEASRILKATNEYHERLLTGKPINSRSIIHALLETYNSVKVLKFSGNPDTDWSRVRYTLESGACPRLNQVAQDVKNIRLLERGTQFRESLSQDWRDNGSYVNALSITQQAFVREHFSSHSKPEQGIVVMNMHKAKGKQFDEVILFEAWPKVVRNRIVANPDRIVWGNSPENCNDQSRQNLRVSITRGKKKTTILTPANDPCILLP